MTTYTVICREVSSPYRPVYDRSLIYTVEIPLGVENVLTSEEMYEGILNEVALKRCEELSADETDLSAIAEGLVIDFVFEGDLTVAFDFRE